jgi:hypothetical protein
MVHGNKLHYTTECEVAQNPTDGHGQLYTLREAGHHAASSRRMRIETGDLGIDPRMDSSDTKGGPETLTHGMGLSYASPTMAPTETSGDIVDFGECGFFI